MDIHGQMTTILYAILGATTIICSLMAWKAIDDCRKARERRKRRKEQRDAKYATGLAALDKCDLSTKNIDVTTLPVITQEILAEKAALRAQL